MATGYAKTEAVERHVPGLFLDTAVAVSGAAVSSNMGSESIKALTPTLALLNFRLGYWMRNPRYVNTTIRRQQSGLYLLTEIFRMLDEHSSEVYLTDGGHIENLGVYELLRRRCRMIIVVDGEADGEMNFGSLIKLQRYARIDLGCRIDLPWAKIRAQSLSVQKGEGSMAKGPHCAIGKIEYEHGGEGVLVYVKSSVSGDENDYVRDYNRRYKAFPHETTGDQFFSEEQFEVYRALGFHIMDGLLTGEHLVETSHSTLEKLKGRAPKGYGVDEVRQVLRGRA